MDFFGSVTNATRDKAIIELFKKLSIEHAMLESLYKKLGMEADYREGFKQCEEALDQIINEKERDRVSKKE